MGGRYARPHHRDGGYPPSVAGGARPAADRSSPDAGRCSAGIIPEPAGQIARACRPQEFCCWCDIDFRGRRCQFREPEPGRHGRSRSPPHSLAGRGRSGQPDDPAVVDAAARLRAHRIPAGSGDRYRRDHLLVANSAFAGHTLWQGLCGNAPAQFRRYAAPVAGCALALQRSLRDRGCPPLDPAGYRTLAVALVRFHGAGGSLRRGEHQPGTRCRRHHWPRQAGRRRDQSRPGRLITPGIRSRICSSGRKVSAG
ncbi:MAG: peptidase inhibitor family I36 protein [Pseudomonadales bacterium]|nr:peptidase inhibitor family I36 protein [Pseudomonadales bacterium]